MQRISGLVGVLLLGTLVADARAQCFEKKLFDPLPESSGHYGQAVDVSNDVVAVGSVDAVNIYRQEADGWQFEQRFEFPGMDFGHSVAISEDWLVVGAPLAVKDGAHITGSAMLFTFDGESWNLHQRLYPNDNDAVNFGSDVAIDGSLVVIGAPGEHISDGGSVSVYRNRGARWRSERVFSSTFRNFGKQVALDNTGNGAHLLASSHSSTQLYRYDGLQWTYVRDYGSSGDVAFARNMYAQLLSVVTRDDGVFVYLDSTLVQILSFPFTTTDFGYSLDGDGSTLVISDRTIQNWPNQVGTAYVYRCSSECELIKTLYGVSPDPANGLSHIAVSDGTVVLGDEFDGTKGDESGAVYVYGSDGGFRIFAPLQGKPGKVNDFAATCAFAGSEVEYYYGFEDGSTQIICFGSELNLGINNAKPAGVFTADLNGNVLANVFIPNVVRGQTVLVQAVSKYGCLLSNVIEVTFE